MKDVRYTALFAAGAMLACSAADPDALSFATNGVTPISIDDSVYALAETGFGVPCGTLDRPCASLQVAADRLSNERPNLVLLPTTASFRAGAFLPWLDAPLHVLGNGVHVSADGGSGFQVASGDVTFDDVFVENASHAGIACSGGKILVRDSTLQSGAYGIKAGGCDVEVVRTTVADNELGIEASSWQRGLTVSESWIEGNAQAIYTEADPLVIQNNLFLRNGDAGYTRVIELRSRSGTPFFGYNTLVGNFNNCIYVGIVACLGTTTTLTSNISWNNFPDWDGTGEDCRSQVFSCPNSIVSNTLAERPWPGADNLTADPLFVDAANDDYRLQPGSPAIDHGELAFAPEHDYYLNPRLSFGAPDSGAMESVPSSP